MTSLTAREMDDDDDDDYNDVDDDYNDDDRYDDDNDDGYTPRLVTSPFPLKPSPTASNLSPVTRRRRCHRWSMGGDVTTSSSFSMSLLVSGW